MINYEKRILNFLKKNPKLKIDTDDLARLWKRNIIDVRKSVQSLMHKKKITHHPLNLGLTLV